jgi:sporulation protein YlmC with PRC-barrel domain
MRTQRMNLLGLEVADIDGTTLGQVVDTYPFDGGGELELVVLRLRRFGERRMLPVSELRYEGGRLVAPFTRIQIEDSPGLSTGRHADEDPWRSKTYWYYEDPAVAGGPRR